MASTITSSASALLFRSGAKPPSSPTLVDSFFDWSTFLRLWNTSQPQRMASLKRLDAQRHDHELLHVHGVVGVRAAVDDVHHGGRQQPGADAAQVAEQRQPAVVGRGMGVGQRHAQDGVGAEALLVLRAVQFDHAVVEGHLVEGVHAAQLVGQLGVDVVDGLQNPLAEVFRLVAVAKFPGLVDAGAGAAGHGGAAERAVGQFHVDLDGRIAAAIEDLSGADVYNG